MTCPPPHSPLCTLPVETDAALNRAIAAKEELHDTVRVVNKLKKLAKVGEYFILVIARDGRLD